MLTVGQKVVHTGHGPGEIVALNTTEPVSEHSLKLACEAGVAGLCLEGFYNGSRYPYVVLFDSGYQDVYSDASLLTPEQFSKQVFESTYEQANEHCAGPMLLGDVLDFLG